MLSSFYPLIILKSWDIVKRQSLHVSDGILLRVLLFYVISLSRANAANKNHT